MKYRTLGNTGLKVSELCLGTMTFGSEFYNIAILGQQEADKIVAKAIDSGVNFFDTADIYSFGDSEKILANALKETELSRDKLVIATKVHGPMSHAAQSGTGDINNMGLSRKHIVEACEASLIRLKTDYIDLYQVHGWDAITPMEETLEALDHLVKQGKVLYIGCSNWFARHLAKALCTSRLRGWSRFVSLQAYYSLVGRDLENELLPLCREESIGLMTWSPLSGGFLSGKYTRDNMKPAQARRSEFDFPPIDANRGFDAVDALNEIAEQKKASVSQVALAWLLAQPGVSSVIIGANKLSQIEDNLKAVNVTLSADEINQLSATTAPSTGYPQWMIDMQNPSSVES